MTRALALPLILALAAVAIPAPAAADLRLHGEASMGLVRDSGPREDGRDHTSPRVRFAQELKLIITAERETESGLTIGGTVTLEDPRSTIRR